MFYFQSCICDVYFWNSRVSGFLQTINPHFTTSTDQISLFFSPGLNIFVNFLLFVCFLSYHTSFLISGFNNVERRDDQFKTKGVNSNLMKSKGVVLNLTKQ